MNYSDDSFHLSRFLTAQATIYEHALAEIRNGQKRTHWMWFVFPQLGGLGYSATSKQYAIKSLAEADAYLQHPVLGARLLECAEAVVAVPDRSMRDIFGQPDDMKIRSSATLFRSVSPSTPSVFDRILSKYFNGEADSRTLQLIETLKANKK